MGKRKSNEVAVTEIADEPKEKKTKKKQKTGEADVIASEPSSPDKSPTRESASKTSKKPKEEASKTNEESPSSSVSPTGSNEVVVAKAEKKSSKKKQKKETADEADEVNTSEKVGVPKLNSVTSMSTEAKTERESGKKKQKTVEPVQASAVDTLAVEAPKEAPITEQTPPVKAAEDISIRFDTEKKEFTWQVSPKMRLSISSFMGRIGVDIRETYGESNLPGKKGIRMPVEVFEKIQKWDGLKDARVMVEK